jgi:cytochrome c-type biogenesis protein CcmH/NrfF
MNEAILNSIYTQKLNEKITVLEETIEMYKLYKDVQEKQIEALEEQLQCSMKLNEELLTTAKKAVVASYQSI